MTITRNPFTTPSTTAAASTEFAFFVTQTGMTGSTSITGNTVQNVDRPSSSTPRVRCSFSSTSSPDSVNDAIIFPPVSEPSPSIATRSPTTCSPSTSGTMGCPRTRASNRAHAERQHGLPGDHRGFAQPAARSRSRDYVGTGPSADNFANALVQIFKADNDPANQRGEIVSRRWQERAARRGRDLPRRRDGRRSRPVRHQLSRAGGRDAPRRRRLTATATDRRAPATHPSSAPIATCRSSSTSMPMGPPIPCPMGC